MKLKKLFLFIFFTLFLSACQTVTTKIDETTEQEKKELSKWLNKPESDLKSFFGQPDKVEFLKTRNKTLYILFFQVPFIYLTYFLKAKVLFSQP